jgi:hypothetical protein
MKAVEELEREIKRRENELAVFRRALAALKKIKAEGKPVSRRAKRRPLTSAERRKLSESMKKAWQKRKANQKSGAG